MLWCSLKPILMTMLLPYSRLLDTITFLNVGRIAGVVVVGTVEEYLYLLGKFSQLNMFE